VQCTVVLLSPQLDGLTLPLAIFECLNLVMFEFPKKRKYLATIRERKVSKVFGAGISKYLTKIVISYEISSDLKV